MKNNLFLLLTVFILGCDQLETSNNKTGKTISENTEAKNNTENTQRIQSSALETEIKVNIKGTDPEKYAIQFSWPYLEDGKLLRIRLGSVVAEVLPNQTFFTHILPHSQTVTFSFDILDKNRKPEKTFTKTVIIPTDFVSRNDSASIKVDTKIEANRVYLSDEFPLTTNGKTVDIVTNEIHAEKGFIQTFPEKIKVLNKEKNMEEEIPQTADAGKNGSFGGNISISSKKLFGRLKIYMRGEKGGRGYKGDPTDGQMSGTGTPAGDGECGWWNPDSEPDSPIVRCYCKRMGVPGGLGIKGNKGKPGKTGMTGGDTGNIRISIQEYVPLEGFDPTLPKDGGEVVKVYQLPGAGGQGGPGGNGQKGSPGGPGKDPNNSEDCRGAPGPEGQVGDQGDEGPQGNEGKIGLKCIYVGSENVNECTQ